MDRHEFFDEYFIKIYKKFGISRLNFSNGALELDDRDIRNMVFRSENFSRDYESLKEYCKALYHKLKRSFRVRVKKDLSNNYFVNIL